MAAAASLPADHLYTLDGGTDAWRKADEKIETQAVPVPTIALRDSLRAKDARTHPRVFHTTSARAGEYTKRPAPMP